MTSALGVVALFSLVVATPRVAVMPVRGDVNGSAQAAVRAVLADAKMKLVDVDEVARLIASAAKSGIACDASEPGCATRICAFGGLDFALVVDAGAPSRGSVALYDCTDGREVRKSSARLDDAARGEGLAMLARAAVGEAEVRGRIEVEAPAGGVVVVDGIERGAAPPPLDVEAGVHDVKWRAPNGGERAQTVDVPAAASARVSFVNAAQAGAGATADAPVPRRRARPADAPSSGVTLAAGGVAVGAVLAIGGGAGAFIIAPADRASITARAYNDDVLIGRILLGVGVAGGVLALVAGGALLVEGAP